MKNKKTNQIKTYLLAHVYVPSQPAASQNWAKRFLESSNTQKMIAELKKICGCDIHLTVSSPEVAIKIASTEELDNLTKVKACEFLEHNEYVEFDQIDANIAKKDEINKEEVENIYRLFDTSYLASGMYLPRKNNLVSKDKQNNITGNIGFMRDIKTIEEQKEDKIVINGEVKLYENKYFNRQGKELSWLESVSSSIEAKLYDMLNYRLTIILSDNKVAKITTQYKDSRTRSSKKRHLLNFEFPGIPFTRDAFLPYPKQNGTYEGVIEEYYMRSTDGQKLLHYATHTPYFEIYDIPLDFDFIKNNKALEENPSIYDIRNLTEDDPRLTSVKDLIDMTIKKLELTNNDTNN